MNNSIDINTTLHNIDNDVTIKSENITYVRGFKTTEQWSNKINTDVDTVGKYSVHMDGQDSGVFLHGDQFNGTDMRDTAGWVSFMWDGAEGYVNRFSSNTGRHYDICSIWGEDISEIPATGTATSDEAYYNERKVIRLFIRRKESVETQLDAPYVMYLDDMRLDSGTTNKKYLGDAFEIYDDLGGAGSTGGLGALNTALSQRYFLLTWNSDQSEVALWSGNHEGNIVKTVIEWDFDEKITDGGFYGLVIGCISDKNGQCIKASKYDDIQMQLGEYLDPAVPSSIARFANIMNQFPAYDNFIGYKHVEDQNQLDEAYNNGISFTKTETTDVKPRKNMIRWSDINRNAFPDLYFKSVREPIMKIVPAPSFLQYQYQNTFLIYTRNSINRFVLEGSASGWQGSSSTLIEERTQYGLYAPESMVRIGETLFWLSEVGVIMWDSDGLRLISKNIIDVDISKTYFGFENSINNQYILAQKTPDTELYVYHVDRNLWTKFNNMGHGSADKGISQAVSLTGGSQIDNINLIYGHDDDKHIYQYPASTYTSEDSTIQTKEMFFEKGILRRVKAGYTGDDILFSSIVIKDDVDRSEITKTHTVALEANKWRGIPLGYNRGKSVVFQIDNADTIESIMYDLDIHAEVTV